MPIYEYSCSSCGRITEAWQKFSDAPLCQCNACGGHLKKLISQNSFHLKGSGWYVTDYAGKSAPGGKSTDKPAEKSENKPATTGTADKKADQ